MIHQGATLQQPYQIRHFIHRELYTKFNVLPLDKLHNHQIILLVFKCLNYAYLFPPLYANYFVLNADVHDYNTRASTNLLVHVVGPRSTFGQRCIRYKGSMLWNRLPAID